MLNSSFTHTHTIWNTCQVIFLATMKVVSLNVVVGWWKCLLYPHTAYVRSKFSWSATQ